jgi:hypothetical protein
MGSRVVFGLLNLSQVNLGQIHGVTLAKKWSIGLAANGMMSQKHLLV